MRLAVVSVNGKAVGRHRSLAEAMDELASYRAKCVPGDDLEVTEYALMSRYSEKVGE